MNEARTVFLLVLLVTIATIAGVWLASMVAPMWSEPAATITGAPVSSDGNGSANSPAGHGRDTADATAHPAATTRNPSSLSPTLREWVQQWSVESATDRKKEVLAQGIRLARERSDSLAELLQSDPRTALEESLRWDEWLALPPEVQVLTEQPISEWVHLESSVSCDPATGAAHHQIRVTGTDAFERRAFSHGRRELPLTRTGTPAQGFVLRDLVALRANAVQVITGAEAAAVEILFPVVPVPRGISAWSGAPVEEDNALTVLAAGRVFVVADEGEVRALRDRLHAWEDRPGADGGVTTLAAWLATGEESEFVPLAEALEAPEGANPWTETPKRLLMMRVDFSDLTGAREEESVLVNKLVNDVSPAIDAMSYGKTNLIVTVTPEVIRLPQLSTYYPAEQDAGRNGNGQLHTDARAGATALGYVMDDYDFLCVQFKGIGMGYGGLAIVGGGRSWIQSSGTGVFVHEFGHNYGAGHASRWLPDPIDGPFGAGGTNVEYGSGTSMMGGGPFPEGHFDPQAKTFLGWLEDSQALTVTTSGRYRLYRADGSAPLGASQAGALRMDLPRTSFDTLWIGYKRAIDWRRRLSRGVQILWEKVSNPRKAWLVQAGREGSFDPDDFELPTGQTFSVVNGADSVHITPVARGGHAPREWIDIEIQLDTPPGNQAPAAAWTREPPPGTTPFQTVRFDVQASDPDGDALAFHWDAGDGGEVSVNDPTFIHTYQAPGSYTATVEVSDMKGGVTTLTSTVNVSTSAAEWTQRSSGTTSRFNAVTASSTRAVAVSGTGIIVHSTDGASWVSIDLKSDLGLNGMNFDEVLSDGSSFVAVGRERAVSGDPWEGCIYHSSDGITWTRVFLGGPRLLRVAYGNGTWVATGQTSTVLKSDNGTTWTAVPFPISNNVQAVAYGNGTWLVMADSNSMRTWAFTSSDLTTWVEQTWAQSFTNNKIARPLRWMDERFFFAGFALGLRTVSPDGTTLDPMPEQEGFLVEDMVETSGQIFVTGNINEDDVDKGHVHSVVPGGNWFRIAIPEMLRKRGIAVFDGKLIIVGDGGEIWQSGTLFPPSLDGWFGWQLEHSAALGIEDDPFGVLPGSSLPNIYHYAVDNPPGGGGVPRYPSYSCGSLGPLVMQVHRNGLRPDVNWFILRSTDLMNWSTGGVVITRDDAEMLEGMGTGPGPGGTEFLRLGVELDPE